MKTTLIDDRLSPELAEILNAAPPPDTSVTTTVSKGTIEKALRVVFNVFSGSNKKAIDAELRHWKDKAIKAAGKGKAPAVKFHCDVVPDVIAQEIHARLESAQTVDDVRDIFAGIIDRQQPQDNDWKKSIRIVPEGASEPLPLIPDEIEITADDIEKAANRWDEAMRRLKQSEYVGLINADTDDTGDVIDQKAIVDGVKGGERSGNWGHAGRPGEVGGSMPGGGLDAIGASDQLPTSDVRKLARLFTERRAALLKAIPQENRQAVASAMSQAMKYMMETGNEVIYGIKDGQIVSSKTGDNKSVTGLDDLLEKSEIFVHNHPRSFIFSQDDFKTFLSSHSDAMVVICSNGDVYWAAKTDKAIPALGSKGYWDSSTLGPEIRSNATMIPDIEESCYVVDYVYKKHFKTATNFYNDQLGHGLTDDEATRKAMDYHWTLASQDFGTNYGKISYEEYHQ